MSGMPCHIDLNPGRNIYLTIWLILSVLFLTLGETPMVSSCVRNPLSQGPPPQQEHLRDQLVHSVCVFFYRRWDIWGPFTCPRSPITWISTLVEMSTSPAGSFCLCCFWQTVGHLWSLYLSRIPHQMDLHTGRNVYLTSWFMLSVLFFTGGEISYGPPPWQECLPDQLIHSVCVVFDWRCNICGPYMCPWSPITRTSTLVLMSTWPAGSFCLCCFWQVVRCLWSLYMSGIPHHLDLHPDRNIYLTSWFILSVLFLTGGETSVVPTSVRDPPSHRPSPQ